MTGKTGRVGERAKSRRTTARIVEPELLDELPQTDRRAIQSRRDLQRINAWMGNAGLLSSVLSPDIMRSAPKKVAELGGGDGSLMLEVANRLKRVWRGVTLDLVDRQDLLTKEVAARFSAVGWTVRSCPCDVFEWLERSGPTDLITANLFLHHFEGATLSELLRRVSQRARLFAACEPRRIRFPRLAGFCVLLIGCNAVTRHDAIKSVRAGFSDRELSAHWPEQTGWDVAEGDAGFSSHWFRARRR